MKKSVALFAASLCLFFSSCHRPVAYFQRTPHVAARLPVDSLNATTPEPQLDSVPGDNPIIADNKQPDPVAVVSLKTQPTAVEPTRARIDQRMHRIESMLATPTTTIDKQPRPKPKPKSKLRLGNRIRQELGVPLRQELTWWQRISWRIKASVIVILVAVVFAILHIGVLAIIFGLLGAFLLITGLKKSFKTRRPWF